MLIKSSSQELRNKFCLMSWNTFKIDYKNPQAFRSYITNIHSEHNVDIFCLQEAVHHDDTVFPIENFNINFASNIILKNHNYGVATVSHYPVDKNIKILTTHRESVIKTHKASLISHIKINDKKIVVVNIHAINFKSNKVYEYEFEKIKEIIDPVKYKNPIIIAGDFNTWNRKRVKLIKDFCREFKFRIAFLDEPDLVKSFQKNHLDFILYRGLKLDKACVLDCKKISDHNPIVAEFILE
ncbi:endonuclease/exonuclease/phosphatase family protein [Allofrancisella inopinata]|uniref:Endonuclease/exonuclease/phosphatase family protein n=1 Tax=Allofrancisella inopinata TaxID=1085647 RepID=A0AAE6YJ94_9GAMM|nr:endonuclease/exonuclease/phosphatase family protein [Allofrancisella inopinata]QIV96773.1 endonuclease/exonuclease/phosphatase family protein [Allofrancisella inopinata]TDT73534.1 endonuclease/exonuclease/phosphatase family protein [Allofrancisella inopinata]